MNKIRNIFVLVFSLLSLSAEANPNFDQYALCRTDDYRKIFVVFHEYGQKEIRFHQYQSNDPWADKWTYAGEIVGQTDSPNHSIVDRMNYITLSYQKVDAQANLFINPEPRHSYYGIPAGGFELTAQKNGTHILAKGPCFFSREKPVLGRDLLQALYEMFPTGYGVSRPNTSEECSMRLFPNQTGATLQGFNKNPYHNFKEWANLEIDQNEPWIGLAGKYTTMANSFNRPLLKFGSTNGRKYDSVEVGHPLISSTDADAYCSKMKPSVAPTLPQKNHMRCDMSNGPHTVVIPSDRLRLNIYSRDTLGAKPIESTPLYYFWQVDPVTSHSTDYNAVYTYHSSVSRWYVTVSAGFMKDDRTKSLGTLFTRKGVNPRADCVFH